MYNYICYDVLTYCFECAYPKRRQNWYCKDNFYEDLEQVFGQFNKYDFKNFSEDFNEKSGKDILKQNA